MTPLKQHGGSDDGNALRLRNWPAEGRPAIETEDPPFKRHDYPELFEMACLMRDTRRKGFPAMIGRGDITQEEADRQLELFDEIAEEWRWIITGEGKAGSYMTLHDRREALDTSIATIASIASRRGGFDADLAHQAHCVIALRWHLDPERRTLFLAEFNHSMRRQVRAKAGVSANAK